MEWLQSYVADLVLCGITYTILVFLMIRWLNKRTRKRGNDSEGDGGVPVFDSNPVIDLPPGVVGPAGDSHISLVPTDTRPSLNERLPAEV